MKDIDELLCKHNIKYFLDGGTLLGLARSGGAIPYDDDIDISIFYEDAQKIQSLEKELNQLGYNLILKYPDWYVISSKNIAMDVFHMKKRGSIYRYADDRARVKWSRFFLYENELFPLQRRKFGDIQVYTPKDSSAYLRRGYGGDCMEYAIFSGNHRTGYIGAELKVAIKDVPELQIPATDIASPN
jgi:phosphorylcholine metabolism protein LicD